MKYLITMIIMILAAISVNIESDPAGEEMARAVNDCIFELSEERIANINGLAEADQETVHNACVAHLKGESHLLYGDEWEQVQEAQRLEDEALGY
jgi:hypothetical protein